MNGSTCVKKKVVLIHPMGECWIAGEKDVSRIANIMPPLGLCSLAAWVEQHLKSDPVKGVIGFNKMPGLDIYYAADACYEEKAQTQRSYALSRRC